MAYVGHCPCAQKIEWQHTPQALLVRFVMCWWVWHTPHRYVPALPCKAHRLVPLALPHQVMQQGRLWRDAGKDTRTITLPQCYSAACEQLQAGACADAAADTTVQHASCTTRGACSAYLSQVSQAASHTYACSCSSSAHVKQWLHTMPA